MFTTGESAIINWAAGFSVAVTLASWNVPPIVLLVLSIAVVLLAGVLCIRGLRRGRRQRQEANR